MTLYINEHVYVIRFAWLQFKLLLFYDYYYYCYYLL